jgi:hypothetical protein
LPFHWYHEARRELRKRTSIAGYSVRSIAMVAKYRRDSVCYSKAIIIVTNSQVGKVR